MNEGGITSMSKETTSKGNSNDILKVEGVNSKGYGIIPKKVMQDKNLTAMAKCIYAYFCSYAGAETQPFPSRERILADLCISKSTYYTHLELLKQNHYIKVQKRTIKGKFSTCIYTLVQNPGEESMQKQQPCPKIQDTVKEKPCPKIWDTVPCPKIQDTNINTLINNNSNINLSIIDINKECKKQKIDKIDYLTSLVKKNVGYENLLEEHPLCCDAYDNILNLIIEVLISTSDTMTVTKEIKSTVDVQNQFLKLSRKHIEFVQMQLANVKNKINNMRAYLLAMLYTSPSTVDMYWTNEVSVTLPGYMEITAKRNRDKERCKQMNEIESMVKRQ